jgi:hypothetical protein
MASQKSTSAEREIGIIVSSVKSEPQEDSNGFGEDFLADEKSPVKRQFLTEAFQQALTTFRLDQRKLSLACDVSDSTISNIVKGRGDLVTWKTWQMVIAGLITFNITCAHNFWKNLPEIIRKSIKEHTDNETILKYIGDINEFKSKNLESLIDSVNNLFAQAEPDTLTDEVLSRIVIPTENGKDSINLADKLKSSLDSNGTGSQVVFSGTANFNCQGPVSIANMLVLPNGVDLGKLEVSSLINSLLSNTKFGTSTCEGEK